MNHYYLSETWLLNSILSFKIPLKYHFVIFTISWSLNGSLKNKKNENLLPDWYQFYRSNSMFYFQTKKALWVYSSTTFLSLRFIIQSLAAIAKLMISFRQICHGSHDMIFIFKHFYLFILALIHRLNSEKKFFFLWIFFVVQIGYLIQ